MAKLFTFFLWTSQRERTVVQNVFFPAPKVFFSSTFNTFVLSLEGGLKNLRKNRPEKSTETRQRQKNARRLPYICCVFLQMPGSLLAFFHFCLVSVLFPGPSLTEMKFYRNFFPQSICIVQEINKRKLLLHVHAYTSFPSKHLGAKKQSNHPCNCNTKPLCSFDCNIDSSWMSLSLLSCLYMFHILE